MGLFSKKKKSVSRSQPKMPEMVDVQAGPTLANASHKSEKRYRRSIWWVEHREGLKKAFVILIIAIEVLIGIIGIWKFIDYYVFNYVEEQALVESFFVGVGDLADVTREQAPDDLKFKDPLVLSSGDSYDILSFVSNENPDWITRLSYHYSFDDRLSDSEQVIILQGETLPLVTFGVESPRPRNPKLVVEDVEWFRIDSQEIPHPIEWKNERINLNTSDIDHDDNFRIGDKIFGRTSFNLTNKTGYGYYEVDLYVILKRGSVPVGVNRTVLSDLLPRESRNIQLNWFDATPRANEVELYPRVNLFDGEVYRPESLETPIDIRDVLQRRRR
jgi:hypothetical protein